MAHEIEFEWDDENVAHLALHNVVPGEFEALILNEPPDLRYEMVNGEERYRSAGITNGGGCCPLSGRFETEGYAQSRLFGPVLQTGKRS